MQKRSVLKIIASLAGLAGACSADDYYTTPYYYDYYTWPVVDYGYNTDTALWYDGYYDPYIGFSALTAARPGDDAGGPRVFPRPLDGLLAAWRVQLRRDCDPAAETADYDGDGVPASYDATFNCVDQVIGDRTASLTGSVSIADADDNAKLSGFTVTFTNFTVSTSFAGTTRTRTLNGMAKMTPLDVGGFQSDTNLSIAFDFSDAGASRIQGTYTAMGQAMFTSDAPGGDVFAGGTVSLSGTGTLASNFRNTQQSRTLTRQTTAPLHWNRACRQENPDSSGFDSGTLVYQDDKGSKVSLTFKGCGNAMIMWSGT